MNNKIFYDKFDNAEKVLVGIGKGFGKNLDKEDIISCYERLAGLLSEKDYFVVNVSDDLMIKESAIDLAKITSPLDETVSEEENEAKWNEYTAWLQRTLNKNLCILELGVGFDMPTLVRWPFEKIAMLNNKAFLCRVNESFPQLPDDIGDKGISVKIAVEEFIETIYTERFGN